MKNKEVLLVNDDFQEVISVKGILDDLSSDHVLHIVKNAQDALNVLMGSSADTNNPVRRIMPDVILLKQNLPDMQGIEFLEIVRKYYSLDTIKIFLLIEPDAGIYQLMLDKLMIAGCLQKPFEDNRNNSQSIRLLKAELDSNRSSATSFGSIATLKAKFKTGLSGLKEHLLSSRNSLLSYSAAPKIAACVASMVVIGSAVSQQGNKDQVQASASNTTNAPVQQAVRTLTPDPSATRISAKTDQHTRKKTRSSKPVPEISEIPEPMANNDQNATVENEVAAGASRSPIIPKIKAVADSSAD